MYVCVLFHRFNVLGRDRLVDISVDFSRNAEERPHGIGHLDENPRETLIHRFCKDEVILVEDHPVMALVVSICRIRMHGARNLPHNDNDSMEGAEGKRRGGEDGRGRVED